MGHYRSEMGFEEEDRQRENEDQRRRKNVMARIKKDIEERGIEAVLTDIVFEGTRSYRIRRF